MSEHEYMLQIEGDGSTPEQVLDSYRQQFTPFGNDIDILVQSMLLILSGHYRESMQFALRVQSPSAAIEWQADDIDEHAAKTAFIAALERSRPLFEEIAKEIEGDTNPSKTQGDYLLILEMLRTNQDW